MHRSEARTRLKAAEEWHRRGLLDGTALAALREELETAGAAAPSLAIQTFYALGGVLLAGATAALYALLEINGLIGDGEATAWAFFAGWGIIFLVSSAAIHSILKDHSLGEAVALGSLVILAILLGPKPPLDDALVLLPLVAAAGVLYWRRNAMLIALAALALIQVGVPVALYRMLDHEGPTIGWAVFAFAAFAAANWVRIAWRPALLASTTAGASFAWLAFIFDVIEPSWQGGEEVLFAMGVGILLAAGLLLKERLVALVAGLALTVDTVVFAFDVGDVTAGLITLIVLGVGLIVAATQLRRQRA